jgi:AmmeMemoRadiSam system protein B
MHARIRPPAVAGRFYPAPADVLRATVRELLATAPADDPPRSLRAMIVPHAGYIYSGAVAATAYRRLAALRGAVDRVVLLGPAHYVLLDGLALPAADALATPLGDVPLDGDGVRRALALPAVHESDVAHAREHSLEVQLPFLQEVLGGFTLVPLAVGAAGPRAVAAVLDLFLDDARTLVLVSTDLSHYLGYEEARRVDRATADAILALRAVDADRACGAAPLNGLLATARARRLRPSLLDLRNSGDTAGDRARVVGYGAFALEAATE